MKLVPLIWAGTAPILNLLIGFLKLDLLQGSVAKELIQRKLFYFPVF